VDAAPQQGSHSAASITEPEETATGLATWFWSLGLERHDAAYHEMTSPLQSGHLTAEHLKEFGGHRRQVSAAVTKLREGARQAVSPTQSYLASLSVGEHLLITSLR
jgi:hypothetical protein